MLGRPRIFSFFIKMLLAVCLVYWLISHKRVFASPNLINMPNARIDFGITTHQGITFPAQSDTGSGSIVVAANSASHAANFSSTGPAGTAGQAKILKRSIELAHNGATLKANGYTYGGNLAANGRFHYPTGSNATTIQDLQTGATLTLPANTAPGLYIGTGLFRITIKGTRKQVSFPVSIDIIASHVIEITRQMIFPPQLSTFNSSYTLYPSSSCSGCAQFSVSGSQNQPATAHIIESSIRLTKSGTNKKITVNNFRFGGFDEGTITPISGHFTFPPSQSSPTTVAHGILVGATATYPRSMPEGIYTGTATLSITYQ